MGKEIDINTNIPHKVSEVICVKCHVRWIAVRPTETKLKDLECPMCGKGYCIETGEIIDITDGGPLHYYTLNDIKI